MKYRFVVDIGNYNLRVVTGKITYDYGDGWVRVEFPHPTLKNQMCSTIKQKDALTPVKP